MTLCIGNTNKYWNWFKRTWIISRWSNNFCDHIFLITFLGWPFIEPTKIKSQRRHELFNIKDYHFWRVYYLLDEKLSLALHHEVELFLVSLGKIQILCMFDPYRFNRGKIDCSSCNLGSISPTFYAQLLLAQIPKVQKRQSNHRCLFALSRSLHVKDTRKMLVQLTLGRKFSWTTSRRFPREMFLSGDL